MKEIIIIQEETDEPYIVSNTGAVFNYCKSVGIDLRNTSDGNPERISEMSNWIYDNSHFLEEYCKLTDAIVIYEDFHLMIDWSRGYSKIDWRGGYL